MSSRSAGSRLAGSRWAGWGALSAATGALLVVAAAPTPGTDTAPSAAPGKPVTAWTAAARPAIGVSAAPPDGTLWRGTRCTAIPGNHGLCLPPGGTPSGVLQPLAFGSGAARQAVHPGGPLVVAAGEREARLLDVSVRDDRGLALAGVLSGDARQWSNSEPLRAGTRYTVTVTAERIGSGHTVERTLRFRTAPPTDRRLTVTFGPKSGTYGVGQPVEAVLSHPVPARDPQARAVVERALRVTSQPAVEGSWHWVDNATLHYRPKQFWPPNSRVEVHSALDGIRVNAWLYGGRAYPAKSLRLTIGDRIEAITDASEHYMTVKRNGRVINTIPVTTGKAGYRTRNGIKVVLEKTRQLRMRGESIGIARGSRDYFDLPVHYATRVTWSGEYVHAAPWSVASQGSANVSHGCTGMSMDDAAWFYETVRPGDIVQVINSEGERMAPFGNGFGDWNLTWKKWRGKHPARVDTAWRTADTVSARLRPGAA